MTYKYDITAGKVLELVWNVIEPMSYRFWKNYRT